MKERIIYTLDRCNGEYGLLLKGLANSYTYPSTTNQGIIIAHDLVEHQQGIKSIGSVGDELIALGGVWRVRGDSGMLGIDSYYSPEENLSRDVVNLAESYLIGVPLREDTNKYYRTSTSEWIECVSELSKKTLRDHYDYSEVEVSKYLDKAKYLMSKGYRMASRRFQNCDCAYSLYSDIACAIDEIKYPEEYQEWEIQYSFTSREVSLKEIGSYHY